jgi:hypothetical protein
MRQSCYRPEELAELLELEAGDPRREHLAACPRCRALLAEYRQFLEPRGAVPGADLPDAERRLRAVLRREILGEERTVPETPGGRFLARLRRIGSTPGFRPALAVAATVLLLFLGWEMYDRRPPGSGRPVLRQQSPPEEGAAGAGFALEAARFREGGAVELRWAPAAGAEAYRVLLFTADLQELAVLGPLTETRVLFQPRELSRPLEPGTVLVWHVAALQTGDEIARSSAGAFRLP